MKKTSTPYTLLFAFAVLLIQLSCGTAEKKIESISVKIDLGDGTSEEKSITSETNLLLNRGEKQYLITLDTAEEKMAQLQVTSFILSADTASHSITIKKQDTRPAKLDIGKKSAISDSDPGLFITMNTVSFLQERLPPRGACKGICCEATCFSTMCCADPDECSGPNTCKCKPTGPCPGDLMDPSALVNVNLTIQDYISLLKSGKAEIVIRSVGSTTN